MKDMSRAPKENLHTGCSKSVSCKMKTGEDHFELNVESREVAHIRLDAIDAQSRVVCACLL